MSSRPTASPGGWRPYEMPAACRRLLRDLGRAGAVMVKVGQLGVDVEDARGRWPLTGDAGRLLHRWVDTWSASDPWWERLGADVEPWEHETWIPLPLPGERSPAGPPAQDAVTDARDGVGDGPPRAAALPGRRCSIRARVRRAGPSDR